MSSFIFSCSTTKQPTNYKIIKSKKHIDSIRKAEAAIKKIMHEKNVPGLSVAVAKNGKIIWSQGFGHADLENNVPVTTDTRFRIASVSKTITAAAIGKLVNEGKLDLDAPIQKYVPYFPKKRWPITTRLVAGHLAGIRHYKGDEFYSAKRYKTVKDSLSIFMDDPLEFKPASNFQYSSYGWNLISAVIEGASGMAFLDYLEKNIFEPLNLKSITADKSNQIIKNRAKSYICKVTISDCVLENARYVDNSNKWAGGGLLSNSEDLVKFALAHLNESIFPKIIFEELTKQQKTSSGKLINFGIGWMTGKDNLKKTAIGHSGGGVGAHSWLRVYIKEKVVIAYAFNRGATRKHKVGLYNLANIISEPFTQED